MTEIQYTDYFADWSSTVCQQVWYNRNSRDLYVSLNIRLYKYPEFELSKYMEFRASNSTGSYYNNEIKFRHKFASEYLGLASEFEFGRVNFMNDASAGTPKDLKVPEIPNYMEQITWNNTANVNVGPSNKFRHVVVFVTGGSEKSVEVYGESVKEVLQAVQVWESALDLDFNIKRIVTHFD